MSAQNGPRCHLLGSQQVAMRLTVLLVASLAVLPAVGLAALAWFTGG